MLRIGRTIAAVAAMISLIVAIGSAAFFLQANEHWVIVAVPQLNLSEIGTRPALEYESPLAIVIACAVATGALLSALLFLPYWFGHLLERHRYRRIIRDLKSELADLRNLSVLSSAPLDDLLVNSAQDERGTNRDILETAATTHHR